MSNERITEPQVNSFCQDLNCVVYAPVDPGSEMAGRGDFVLTDSKLGEDSPELCFTVEELDSFAGGWLKLRGEQAGSV